MGLSSSEKPRRVDFFFFFLGGGGGIYSRYETEGDGATKYRDHERRTLNLGRLMHRIPPRSPYAKTFEVSVITLYLGLWMLAAGRVLCAFEMRYSSSPSECDAIGTSFQDVSMRLFH